MNHLTEPEPVDTFRNFLASIRGEGSRGRVAHRVLLMGHGPTPCKEGVRELLRLGLDWMPKQWCALYQGFTGDSSIVLADLWPTPEPIPLKPGRRKRTADGSPQYTYRTAGERFIGVLVRKRECVARIRHGKAGYVTLGHGTAAECAVMYDAAVRQRGTGGKLNHRPEPVVLFHLPIVRPAPALRFQEAA